MLCIALTAALASFYQVQRRGLPPSQTTSNQAWGLGAPADGPRLAASQTTARTPTVADKRIECARHSAETILGSKAGLIGTIDDSWKLPLTGPYADEGALNAVALIFFQCGYQQTPMIDALAGNQTDRAACMSRKLDTELGVKITKSVITGELDSDTVAGMAKLSGACK